MSVLFRFNLLFVSLIHYILSLIHLMSRRKRGFQKTPKNLKRVRSLIFYKKMENFKVFYLKISRISLNYVAEIGTT